VTREVTVICDRCGRRVRGLRFLDPPGTSGFYDTGAGSGWARFADPGENLLCDSCMWLDPRYASQYGRQMGARA
jgi:hypothetical protein